MAELSSQEQRPESATIVVTMLRRMLRPLVRLLVAQQIQYPLVSRLLKALYIEVATEDFALAKKRVTVSRLSLLSGIHRREVKRIQEDALPEESRTPSAITLGAQIVARWTGQEPWVDSEGKPRPLPRQSDDPEEATFQTLVNSVSVDIHPRSVLDEWIRIGVASLTEANEVVLNADAFVPSKGFEEKAHFIGRNVRDHLAAAAGNLEAETSPFLERSVFYGSLPPQDVETLREFALEVGQEALLRVNERARALKSAAVERGEQEGPEHRRITFGVYEFDAPAQEEEPEEVEGESDED